MYNVLIFNIIILIAPYVYNYIQLFKFKLSKELLFKIIMKYKINISSIEITLKVK